ncbi:MAG: class I SAM-dependent methyltransferase [Anaerolineae bacterium]|jgi:ubiquinone/menaquinone biosynthesis C-methylase UbiE|nr:class I SAM-dependent methyltransferase [Anaerolineae bacterium]
MSEHRFKGSPESLRSKDRNQLTKVMTVVDQIIATFEPASVCDIGCGAGNFLEEFTRRGLVVSGVDVNPRMVEAVREYAPDTDVHLAPAEKLPFDDRQFDVAFLSFVYHEVDDQMKTLMEARRVAKKGIAILDFPYDRVLMGPPKKIRIRPEKLQEQCAQAGLGQPEIVEYEKSVLYLIPMR